MKISCFVQDEKITEDCETKEVIMERIYLQSESYSLVMSFTI